MKTPIIFLPGMMCDARLFEDQISRLKSHRTVIVGDLSKTDSVQSLAKSILDEAPQKFILAGLSMGGIVAMELVRQAASRVEGLILMNTNPHAENAAVKVSRAPQMKTVAQGGLKNLMEEVIIPRYLFRRDQHIENLCLIMAESLGAQVFLNQSLALRDRMDQQETLRNYNNPGLIVCGRQDKLCPIDRHELMDDLLPNSQLSVIENCGHLPTLEYPEQTTDILVSWIDDHGF